MKVSVVILAAFLNVSGFAQTLGGNSVFNFLKLSNTPQLSSLGGVNISAISDDIGLVFNNPALLKPSMHTQMNAVFNTFYGGIKGYHLSFCFLHEQLNTNFLLGLNYFNYSNNMQTNASGNELGTNGIMESPLNSSTLTMGNSGPAVLQQILACSFMIRPVCFRPL